MPYIEGQSIGVIAPGPHSGVVEETWLGDFTGHWISGFSRLFKDFLRSFSKCAFKHFGFFLKLGREKSVQGDVDPLD